VLVAAAICTKTSYWHTGEWRYYLFVMVPLIASVALAWPEHIQIERVDPIPEKLEKNRI
jgi:hypothetical protein